MMVRPISTIGRESQPSFLACFSDSRYTTVVMEVFGAATHSMNIFNDDVLNLYDTWDYPIVIISDGPYGIGGFPGDPPTPDSLAEWYEPHVQKWTEKSTPQTTLWFWGTELSWVNVHQLLKEYGWEYRAANTWNKGLQHIAGNSNTKSLRQLPVVTEICVQYVKKPFFHVNGREMTLKKWLRYEWGRTGLPLYKTNEKCCFKKVFYKRPLVVFSS